MALARIVTLPQSPSNARSRQVFARLREADAAQCTDVFVLFTSVDETLAALRLASRLARSLHGHVRLVDFRVVPPGAPVEAPTGRSPIEMDAFLDRVRDEGIDVRANVYVCRDTRHALPHVFKDRSLIVIGARQRRWPTRAQRLRRMLEARGHFVLFAHETATR